MKKPIVRTQYTKAPDVGLKFKGKSLTKQAFKNECDINNVIKKYQSGGMITHISNKPLKYGDSPSLDFQQTQLALAAANSLFENLPSDKRGIFDSVSDFIEKIGNPDFRDQLIQEGILQAPEGYISQNPEELIPFSKDENTIHPADSEAQAEGSSQTTDP